MRNNCVKNSLSLYLSLITAIIFHTNSYAAEKMRIAVLDFSENNVSKLVAKAVSENMSIELAKKDDFTVIERSQIGKILDEQGFQQTGCTDQACAVQMGQLLSTKKIILGTVSKLGNLYTINAKIVDVETGKVDFADSERCTKEDDIDPASRVLAVNLINKVTGKSYKVPARTFKTEEERNRFAVGVGFIYGWMPGVDMPSFNNTGFQFRKANCTIMVPVVTPSYELTPAWTIKSNLKYYLISIPGGDLKGWQRDDDLNDVHYYLEKGKELSMKASGFGLSGAIQYNHHFGGFIPFVSVGIGYTHYKFENSDVYNNQAYKNLSYEVWKVSDWNAIRSWRFSCKMNNSFYSMYSEIGFGVSIYLSRFVEIVFSGSMEIPFLSSVFSKMYIDYAIREGTSAGLLPTDTTADAIVANAKKADQGNFPLSYYVQAAFNFRVF